MVAYRSMHLDPPAGQTVNFRDTIISTSAASCPPDPLSSPASLASELRETHSLESAMSINSLQSLDHQVTTISSKSKLVIIMVSAGSGECPNSSSSW